MYEDDAVYEEKKCESYDKSMDTATDEYLEHLKARAMIYKRLAAYEETGLEPEEVRRCLEFEDICLDEYIKHERLHELAQADREGRCVVLPCKVGQNVKVDVRTWGNVWNYKTVENGKFLIGEIVAITKTKKQTLVKIRVEHNLSWKRPTRRYPASAIGKTVFLTREEAALRREQE